MHVHQWVVEALFFFFGSDLSDFTFGGQGLGMFLSNEGGRGAYPSGEERAHGAEAVIIVIKCWKTLRRNRNQACSCEGRRKTFRMIPSS